MRICGTLSVAWSDRGARSVWVRKMPACAISVTSTGSTATIVTTDAGMSSRQSEAIGRPSRIRRVTRLSPMPSSPSSRRSMSAAMFGPIG